MRRRILRAGMWVCAVVAVMVGAGLAVGMFRPGHRTMGNYAVGVQGTRLEVAWGAGTVRKSQLGWSITNQMGMADSIMTPKSAWLPSVVPSGMGKVPGGPGPTLEVTALYVPLWPLLVVVVGMTGGFWWWAGPRVRAGHCRCGYDMTGLSGRCPECGREGLVAKLVGVVKRFAGGIVSAEQGRSGVLFRVAVRRGTLPCPSLREG